MYLASIKQTSMLEVNGETIEVSFNLDPESNEQDVIISPIAVSTINEQLKSHLSLDNNMFHGTIDELNEKMKQFPSS